MVLMYFLRALEELGLTDLLTQRGEPGEYARGVVTEDHRIYEAAETDEVVFVEK